MFSSLKYFELVQKLVDPTKIERWAVVNFSARCDTRNLVRDLIKCGEMKGIVSRHYTFYSFLLVYERISLYVLTDKWSLGN